MASFLLSNLTKAMNAIIKVAKDFNLGIKNVKVMKKSAVALYDPKEELEMAVSNNDILKAIKDIHKRLDQHDKYFEYMFKVFEVNNLTDKK